MTSEVAAAEAVLVGRRQPYVKVTVVWARPPTSARAGDSALVTADGRLRGWVGGSCSEPVVVRQALAALAEGRPRLVHLGPPPELPAARDGTVVEPVTCSSEGSLEAFIEPRLPAPHLIAVGRSPLVHALVTMAAAVGFEVVVLEREEVDVAELAVARVVPEIDFEKGGVGPDSFVVVATMGRYDEDALEAVLATPARYVALVASARRAETVRATLLASGMAEEQLARVRAPAGFDLGPIPHTEIAVAILAEIVAERARERSVAPVPEQASTAVVDPVCGMTVDPERAEHAVGPDGTTYWFCGAACRRRFEAAPT